MYIHETKIKVRYAETDQMGIVHHSRYYPWFEEGRTEFILQTGITYGELERQGILLPVIETGCIYKAGAKYEDNLTVRTWIQELKGARITFFYEVIRDADHKLLAQGKTVHAFVNKNFKPINMKKVNGELWDKLLALCGG